MKATQKLTQSYLGGLAALLAALSFSPQQANANVYATNIKLNGSLFGATNNVGSAVTISYILNEPATLGTTINILSGTNVVDTISIPSGSVGTLRGLNSVLWGGTNSNGTVVGAGTYAVSITAAAVGFTNWTQTSIDTNSGMPANYPLGIAVDNNPTSPYYGRVVISNPLVGSNPNMPAAAKKVGLYKMNADGSQADEGWYGNANYLADDAGDAPTAGQMPNSGGYDPMKLRIGEDDRIYWVDNSNLGAIVAADMQATTNQIVIKESGYQNCPEYSDLVYGFQEFDVSATTTTNAAVWLADNDFPNWGVWMFHMTNGVVDPNDSQGTQAIIAGSSSDLSLVSSGGVMVDYNLDIWVGQDRSHENAIYDAMLYTNWNAGVLPPENSAFSFAYGQTTGQVAWGYGSDVDAVSSSDPTFEGVRDMVINSRVNPTILAVPMTAGSDNGGGGGIRLLNATNGAIIVTNLDWGQAYASAAFDNVGNLYGGSTSRNVWRVWSPPSGTNQATTVAVAQVTLVTPLKISSLNVSGTTVTLNFTGSSSASVSSFTLLSSPNAGGPYTPVSGAVITQVSPGVFKATTTTSGAAQFYRLSSH